MLDMKRDTSFFERRKEKKKGKRLSLGASNDIITVCSINRLAIYNFNSHRIRENRFWLHEYIYY